MDALTKPDSPAGSEAPRMMLSGFAMPHAQPNQRYEDIVFLASLVCDSPVALVSMFDSDRRWFKAKAALQSAEIFCANSFCSHVVTQPDALLIVPDALADPRFAGSPWVAGGSHIRSCAGAPLLTRDGYAVGALCVMDDRPREWTDLQKQALLALGRQAAAQAEIDARVADLQESELRFKAFMDNSPVLASLKDEQGRYIYINKPFLMRCGMRMSDILGRNDFELWPEEIARRIRQAEMEVMACGQSVSEVETTLSPGGERNYWQVTRFVLAGQRRLAGAMGLDITEAKRYEQQLMQYQEELKTTLERLEVLSVTDSLTELYNRRAFDEKLRQEFERARRYNLPLSLLLIDVDNFKALNDTLGHTDGDRLLHAVAAMLKENARANDVTARYGGDEFAVILPNTSSRVALRLAERLRWSARELHCDPFRITLSIGVGALSPGIQERSELVIAADRALYAAKRKGRDRVCGMV